MKKKTLSFLIAAAMAVGVLSLMTVSAFALSDAPGGFEGANEMSLNTPFTDNLSSVKDNDCFMFVIESPGRINLLFQRSDIENENELWKVSLHGENMKKICSFGFAGNEEESESYTVGLGAGIYYLRVTAGANNTYTEEEYTLTIRYDRADFFEKEFNGDQDNATPILLNKDYDGTISDANDDDFYSFDIPAVNDYYISFSHPKIKTTEKLWKMYLYNDELKQLAEFSILGNGTSFTVNLDGFSAGAYYLKITSGNYRPNYTTDIYTLSVNEHIKLAFTDVPTNSYYYGAVRWAVEFNVTSGTSATRFSPASSCTRAQVVTFLWRAAGMPEPESGFNPFTDVKSGAFYYKAVLWAVENKITAGTSATRFSPDASCTRAQVVTFLWRFEGEPLHSGSRNPFWDVSDGAYYHKAVLWAVEKKITSGTSKNTFSPVSTCTRAQVVTFLYRDMA